MNDSVRSILVTNLLRFSHLQGLGLSQSRSPCSEVNLDLPTYIVSAHLPYNTQYADYRFKMRIIY